MISFLTRKSALWAGLVSVVLGLLLLFWTNPIIHWLNYWWPLIFMITGAFFWYQVALRKARPRFLFTGTMFFLVGVQLQFISLGVITLAQSWPGFATTIGLSFIPYSLRFKTRVRITLLIPALSLVILSAIFFSFTLKLVPEGYSFAIFATQWWPLVFVVFGLSLLFSYYYRSPNNKEE